MDGRHASSTSLPGAKSRPARALLLRLGIAAGLIFVVALIAYLDRAGYRDAAGGPPGMIDCLYYATVSVTTTGYGDITPATEQARLINTIFVTPMRVAFLILLVGTTVELLTTQTVSRLREARWRKTVRDHHVVCGYGVTGRAAIQTLVSQGAAPEDIVAVDPDAGVLEEARDAGHVVVHGDATRLAILELASIRTAAGVVVAPGNDAAATLITVTARELNPNAPIVASVRESENAHLLHQSGASSVVRSSSSVGRLLGLAIRQPRVVEVLEDLATVGDKLDLVERPVEPGEIGPEGRVRSGSPIIAVVRDDETYRFDHPGVQELRAGDVLVCLCSHELD